MASLCPKSKDLSIRYDIDYFPKPQCKGQIFSFVCVCVCVYVCMLSCVQLFATPWTIACQAPLSMGYSRQEYWSGLPFPPPRDLLDPRIEPFSPASPALAGRFFTTDPPEKPNLSLDKAQIVTPYMWSLVFPLVLLEQVLKKLSYMLKNKKEHHK